MSIYLDAEVLLSECRLQAEKLGDPYGVLIVEGPTDKGLFALRCETVEQIVVAAGKTMAVEAHAAMQPKDEGRLVFIVDCDDDVPRGSLKGAPDLIISTNADMEADLIECGVLRSIVAEAVRGALESEGRVDVVTSDVMSRSMAVAIQLGRVRRATRGAGIALDLSSHQLEFNRIRQRGATTCEIEAALDEVVRAAGLRAVQRSRIEAAISSTGSDYKVCNGKDVVAAAAAVMQMDFGVPRRVGGAMPEMVRLAVNEPLFEQMGIVRRLRRWEEKHGRRILRAA